MTEELYNKIDKFCNETDWSKYPTYEHALEEFIKGIVAEETKELEAQIEKMKCLLNEIYSEYGFSELVRIRNDLPIEIQEVIKEIKENENN